MTREHIEFVLSEYSIDALAGKLLELFDEEAASYQHTINELNKALSENKGDLISRQAVLDLLENTNNGWIINEVLQLPSINSQKNIVNNGTMNITL